jgi:hypothetical protein
MEAFARRQEEVSALIFFFQGAQPADRFHQPRNGDFMAPELGNDVDMNHGNVFGNRKSF